MRSLGTLTVLTLAALVAIVLAAYTSTTGKSAGQSVDDATIAGEVRATLAGMRTRAEEVARHLRHVARLVNNLTVRAQ